MSGLNAPRVNATFPQTSGRVRVSLTGAPGPQGPAGAGSPDATTSSKGSVQLAGDLGGTAAVPTVPALAGKAAKGDVVINVKDYGAVGNGSTDDTAAINSAIQANPGRVIFVPAGTYMINATATVTTSPGSQPAGILMNKANTTLRLDPGATLKAITNGAQRYSVVQVSAADCVIEGGTITGDLLTHTDTLGQWGYCIEITYNLTLGTVADRCQVFGTKCNLAWADGIFVVGNPKDIRIVDVVCDQNRRQGVSITDATRPLILGGHFMNTGTLGTAQNPSAGIDIEPDPSTGRNVIDAMVIGANLTGNVGPGLLVVGATAQTTTATIIGCRASNNTCSNNTAGFHVSGTTGQVTTHFSGCTSVGNTMYGFRAIPDGTTFSGCVARSNGQYGFRLGALTVLTDCVAELNGLHGFSFDATATNSRMTGGGSRANSQTTNFGAANVEIYCTMTVTGHIADAGTLTNKPAYAFLIRSGAVVKILGSDAFGAYSSLISDAAGTTVVSPALGLPTGVPTAAAGANNGTSPPAPVVASTARSNRGNVTFGSGTTPAAGAQCVVTFPTAYATAPYVAVVPRNSATAALGLYVSATAAGSFTLSTTSAPTASQANTVYSFDFLVTG